MGYSLHTSRWNLICVGLCFPLLLVGCGRVEVKRSLRVEPIEKPQHRELIVGKGYALSAQRDGLIVRVRARAVRYCRDLSTQRAQGFQVTERRAVGPSLTMEWLMGAVITATGGGLLTYMALNPSTTARGELEIGTSTRSWVTGAAITTIGVGLLAAAVVQQSSLGRSELALGLKTLKKQGAIRACHAAPATTGRVRLTLSDGHQIEADVGKDGIAALSLPADVATRLQREGRRATLEAIGDWRSQLRISL